MALDDFYYAGPAGAVGPFKPPQLKELVESGVITADTQIWNERLGQTWVPWSLLAPEWSVQLNGKVRGPLSEYDLRRYSKAGKINALTLVSKSGGPWFPWHTFSNQRQLPAIAQQIAIPKPSPLRAQPVPAGPTMPAGAAYGRQVDCYCCGCTIANGQPRFRRKVQSGQSVGNYLSRRSFGVSTRTYFGLRTLCIECARQHDASGCAGVVLILLATPLLVGLARCLA